MEQDPIGTLSGSRLPLSGVNDIARFCNNYRFAKSSLLVFPLTFCYSSALFFAGSPLSVRLISAVSFSASALLYLWCVSTPSKFFHSVLSVARTARSHKPKWKAGAKSNQSTRIPNLLWRPSQYNLCIRIDSSLVNTNNTSHYKVVVMMKANVISLTRTFAYQTTAISTRNYPHTHNWPPVICRLCVEVVFVIEPLAS